MADANEQGLEEIAEQDKTAKKTDEILALELLQHYVMQSEGSWESFQQRIQALRFVAVRLDLAKRLEQQLGTLEATDIDSPMRDEVIRDLDSQGDE